MRFSLLLYLLGTLVWFGPGDAEAFVRIPCETGGDMVWVQVKSKTGEELHFLLDSGAGASVIDLGAARRLGLSLGERRVIQGVGYRATAFSVKDFAASVSGLSLPATLLAFDLSAVSKGCGRRVDGLIGMDFFRKKIVQIDYAKREVRILTRGELGPALGERLPLSVRRDSLCVAVRVEQKAEWMRVDTGCRSALEWVAKPGHMHRLGVAVAVNSRVQPAVLLDVQLGSKCFKHIRVGLHQQRIFPGEAGLLGNGLLSKFVVTLDVEKQALFLKK